MYISHQLHVPCALKLTIVGVHISGKSEIPKCYKSGLPPHTPPFFFLKSLLLNLYQQTVTGKFSRSGVEPENLLF